MDPVTADHRSANIGMSEASDIITLTPRYLRTFPISALRPVRSWTVKKMKTKGVAYQRYWPRPSLYDWAQAVNPQLVDSR